MEFYGCIPRFLKTHGGWILTAVSALASIGAMALMAQEAPEARKEINQEQDARISEALMDYDWGNMTNEESNELTAKIAEDVRLDFWEKTKIALPKIWPALAAEVISLACLLGAQVFNAKKQAALVAAYSALLVQFDQYREAIKAEYGEEADRRAFEVSQRAVEELEEEIRKLKEENGPFLYGIETLPGVIFEAQPGDIHEAVMHFNRNLILCGEAVLSELYNFIGIPETAYNKKLADEFGYSQYQNEVEYNLVYLDIFIEEIEARNGRKVRMIRLSVPPYCVSGPGEEGDILEDYPDYDLVSKRARGLAAAVMEEHDLTRILHQSPDFDNFYISARSPQ